MTAPWFEQIEHGRDVNANDYADCGFDPGRDIGPCPICCGKVRHQQPCRGGAETEDFVKEVSMSDMYEIETSRLALERADAATKTFAQQMMQDHQKTTSELKQLLDSGKVKAAATSTMSEDQNEALGKLKELQGAEFTDEYRDNQIDAHEDAVDIFGRYADSGDNPDLKAWAAKTLPVLKHHLEMARALK